MSNCYIFQKLLLMFIFSRRVIKCLCTIVFTMLLIFVRARWTARCQTKSPHGNLLRNEHYMLWLTVLLSWYNTTVIALTFYIFHKFHEKVTYIWLFEWRTIYHIISVDTTLAKSKRRIFFFSSINWLNWLIVFLRRQLLNRVRLNCVYMP